MKYIFSILFFVTTYAFAADLYPDYRSLAQVEQEEIDYRVRVVDNGSPVTLLAVHGGKIERGSSELARAIDGGFNQYHFEGLKEDNNFSLHITSARFDEPRALDLVARSKDCLSLHGYIGNGENAVCIGGGNDELISKTIAALKNLPGDFEIIYPCHKYPGRHVNNIVNKCQNQGVQLEMSSVFRDRILEDAAFKAEVARVLRTVFK